MTTYQLSIPVGVSYLMCTAPDCANCKRDECPLEKGEILLDRPMDIVLPNRGILHIGKDFLWDGASIPRLCWTTCYHPYHHRIIAAALAHDAMYQIELFPREDCDWIFLEMLQTWGVSWYQRNKMYLAVRAAGGVVWDRHTPEGIAGGKKFVRFTPYEEIAT